MYLQELKFQQHLAVHQKCFPDIFLTATNMWKHLRITRIVWSLREVLRMFQSLLHNLTQKVRIVYDKIIGFFNLGFRTDRPRTNRPGQIADGQTNKVTNRPRTKCPCTFIGFFHRVNNLRLKNDSFFSLVAKS